MKKTLLIGLFALCMISVVHAAGILIVHTVDPDIEATFNESVVLDSYNLTFAATNELFDLDYVASDGNTTFTFNPRSPLPSGFYGFIVTAQDRAGNDKNYTKDLIVDVNQTQVGFFSPIHGISSKRDFNLTLRTNRQAACRYDYIPGRNYTDMNGRFDSTGSTQHKINNYHYGGLEEGTTDMYVSCIDEFNFTIYSGLEVGFDPTPPVINSIALSENPLRSYPPVERMTVDADDEVVCYNNGEFFSGQNKQNRDSYSFKPVNSILYTPPTPASNKDYPYTVFCENLAELPSTSQSVTVTVALEENLSITVLSPARYIQNQLIYKIATNKPATCTATLDGKNTTTLSPDNSSKIHSVVGGTPSEGVDHVINFECKSKVGSEIVTTSFVFTVDNSPPSTPTINATACKSDSLSLSFSSFDNQSGIKGFNYTISGANLSINNTFASGTSAILTGLKLIQGAAYTITAFAINGAGGKSLSSGSVSPPFTFNPNSSISCQEKNPPVLVINASDVINGKKVTIFCYDESGCNQNSFLYGLSPTSACNATRPGKEVTIQSDQYVCAEAADVYGNVGRASKKITTSVFGGACTNGIKDITESDIDCGGSCGACSIGKACSQNRDCEDNSCFNNICAAPSCSNNRTDGSESDSDCGGSCGACSIGKACSTNSDCTSGSCSFSRCESGAPKEISFDDWAAKFGLDSADRDGDFDRDGISNYDEYVNGTDPTNPYDTPGVFASRYLTLGVCFLLILTALLYLYYFHADKQVSLNILFIGIGLLLILIVHWFVMYLPKYVVIALSIVALGGGGYLAYSQKETVSSKITGKKPSFVSKSSAPSQEAEGQPTVVSGKPNEQPLTAEDMSATKQMIEMIRKEKLERENKKKKAFSAFDSGTQDKNSLNQMELIQKKGKSVPLKKQEKLPEKESPKQVKKEPQLPQAKSKQDSEMERLGDLGKMKDVSVFQRLQSRQDAFQRLSKVSESRKDIFSKLPASEKGMEDLSNLGKKSSDKVPEDKKEDKKKRGKK